MCSIIWPCIPVIPAPVTGLFEVIICIIQIMQAYMSKLLSAVSPQCNEKSHCSISKAISGS